LVGAVFQDDAAGVLLGEDRENEECDDLDYE